MLLLCQLNAPLGNLMQFADMTVRSSIALSGSCHYGGSFPLYCYLRTLKASGRCFLELMQTRH
jgi:hypothetical protein